MKERKEKGREDEIEEPMVIAEGWNQSQAAPPAVAFGRERLSTVKCKLNHRRLSDSFRGFLLSALMFSGTIS